MENENTQEVMPTKVEMTLSEIKQKLAEAQALVVDIGEIKNEIKRAKSSIGTSSANVTTQEAAINTKTSTINGLVESATTANTKIAQLVTAVDLYVQKFEISKELVDDEDEGVRALLNQIKATKVSSDALFDEITKSGVGISEIKGVAKNDAEDIEKIKVEVVSYQKEIVDVYGFLTGAGLAHSFRERQTSLDGSAKMWRWFLVVSVALWMMNLGLIAYYVKLPEVFSWTFFLYKITYSAPGLFAVWYSAIQYSRERRLLESYAFKSATAKALESYTDVLSKRFGDAGFQEKILSFVLLSMNTIYRHPSLDGHLPEEEKTEGGMLTQIVGPIAEKFMRKPEVVVTASAQVPSVVDTAVSK